MIWQISGLPTQPQAGCMPTRWRHTMLGGLQKGLGRTIDKSPKAEVQSFAQALSSSEASSSKSKGKASAKAPPKATNKQEKPNQYCNILNLPGSKNNNNKAATMAAYAKSQWGLDLTEVSLPLPK